MSPAVAADVTVVVATRDRRGSLMRSLDRLTALPEQPPVVVVDNDSHDGTPEAVAERFPGVTVVRAGANLGAAGRTLGARHARTPLVAFSDDDSWWEPGALARAAAAFAAHPRLGLLAARTLVGPDGAEDPLNAELAAGRLGREPDLPGPTVLGFLACGCVVRREAFLAVGGFHPRYVIGGEEQLLALDLAAAGWGVAHVPEVVARHHPDTASRRGRSLRTRRNDLWTTWLRRPLPVAVRQTVALARDGLHDPGARGVVGAALQGLPWVVRERRPVPARVERQRRRLESPPGRSRRTAA